jgi:cell pole-organizing protein PopZ
MNQPSTPGDRDFEALRRAQRAHEPSMEEILASIRNIIADDREPAKSAPAKASAQPARDAAPPTGPQIVYSSDHEPPLRVAAEFPPPVEPAPAPPNIVWLQPERETPMLEPKEPAEIRDDERLVSVETNQAVAASFDTLSATMAIRGVEIAEGMVRELLKPMLKSWLDENLPSLVERLVRAEIQRVARGGR